jgi:hypothetical protein
VQEEEEFRLRHGICQRADNGMDGRTCLLLLEEMHDNMYPDITRATPAGPAGDDNPACPCHKRDMDVMPAQLLVGDVRRPCSRHARDSNASASQQPRDPAVDYGPFSILDYGHEFEGEFLWHERALCMAAYHGSVQVLGSVLRAGCERWSLALFFAAARGHLACVRYLHARGFPLWDRVVSAPDEWFLPGFGYTASYPCLCENSLYVQSRVTLQKLCGG